MSKHVHKYIRVSIRFAMIWKCANPDCSHFMPPHLNGILVGRYSICWQCNDKFVLDDDALSEDMPRCADCRLKDVHIDIDEVLASRETK